MKQTHEQDDRSSAGATPSVLADLRTMAPTGHLSWPQALRLAEVQANRLLELSHVAEAPVPDELIRRLPRIQVRLSSLPTSGVTYWDGEHWLIGINRDEPRTRRRFTLVHEYKHIVDHGRTHQLYSGDRFHSNLQQAERAADFFGGCVLMPRRLVREAWAAGLRTAAEIAEGFDVSTRAAEVRLAQLGLGNEPSFSTWTETAIPVSRHGGAGTNAPRAPPSRNAPVRRSQRERSTSAYARCR